MPRPLRVDAPGVLHHVISRGVGKRPLFETHRDFRHFLALLAIQVRKGRIRVHAFVLLHTHFHLLVESVDGELSVAMQQVLSRYVAWFNVTRDTERVGALVSQRYYAQQVDSVAYLYVLLRYIDANAVTAGLAGDARRYAYGSAARFAGRLRTPRWLTTASIRRFLPPAILRGRALSQAYAAAFGRSEEGDAADVVEARVATGRAFVPRDKGIDLWLDDLGHAQRRWLVERARCGDATSPSLPMVTARSVLLATSEEALATDEAPSIGQRLDAQRVARCGLLRSLSGLDHAQIGRVVGCTPATSRRSTRHYVALLADGGAAGAWLTRRAQHAVHACYGGHACAAVKRALASKASRLVPRQEPRVPSVGLTPGGR